MAGAVLVALHPCGTGGAGETRQRLQGVGALGRDSGKPGDSGSREGAVEGLHSVEYATQRDRVNQQQ